MLMLKWFNATEWAEKNDTQWWPAEENCFILIRLIQQKNKKTNRTCSCASWVSRAGMAPVSWLLERSKRRRRCKWPSTAGMEPDKKGERIKMSEIRKCMHRRNSRKSFQYYFWVAGAFSPTLAIGTRQSHKTNHPNTQDKHAMNKGETYQKACCSLTWAPRGVPDFSTTWGPHLRSYYCPGAGSPGAPAVPSTPVSGLRNMYTR